MNDNDTSGQTRPPRPPVWNKGKLIGAKAPSAKARLSDPDETST